MNVSKKSMLIAVNIAVAIIYLQTLFYKFTAHPDSVYIFSQLGSEPYGRYVIGLLELICSIMLLIPASSLIGNVLSLFIIAGAILSHLGPLGIVVLHDGGKLFEMAVAIFCLNILALFLHPATFFWKKKLFP
ncbi:DoxX family protein [Echinicola sediminis]